MREWVWVKAPTGERAYLRRHTGPASARSCVLEPPLRLQLAPFQALAHAAVVASSPFNHMHEAPANSPFGGVSPGAFWLDGVLGYLACEEWVGLLLVSRGWYAAMKAASAWARADLGQAGQPTHPHDMTTSGGRGALLSKCVFGGGGVVQWRACCLVGPTSGG